MVRLLLLAALVASAPLASDAWSDCASVDASDAVALKKGGDDEVVALKKGGDDDLVALKKGSDDDALALKKGGEEDTVYA